MSRMTPKDRALLVAIAKYLIGKNSAMELELRICDALMEDKDRHEGDRMPE